MVLFCVAFCRLRGTRGEAEELMAATTTTTVCLGSSSKWRRRILTEALQPQQRAEGCGAADVVLTTLSPDIDEKAIRRATPAETVTAIAHAKMDAVLALLRSGGNATMPDFVITSDQVVETPDGQVREKPVDAEENRRFLSEYSNSSVATVAGIAVFNVKTVKCVTGLHRTRVHFSTISPDVMDRLISRGDSLQCCGGFVVEDEDLQKCVLRIDGGTVQSVQGVDVPTFLQLLREAGAPL